MLDDAKELFAFVTSAGPTRHHPGADDIRFLLGNLVLCHQCVMKFNIVTEKDLRSYLLGVVPSRW